jgi:hypothetical protein
MDAILWMLVESAIYLVAYLVDWLKWWRALCAMLVAALAFASYCVLAEIPEGSVSRVSIGFLVFGAAVGIALEFYAHRKIKRSA